MDDEHIPRRLRRGRGEEGETAPGREAGKKPAAAGEEAPSAGGWEEPRGEREKPFAGALGWLKPGQRERKEEAPKFYYASQKEGKPEEAGEKEEEETISKEELAKILYEQMERERQLRKETAKLALKEIKNFRRQYLRYPEEHEYEEIAENICQQVKGEYEKIAETGKPAEAAQARRRRYMEAQPKEEAPAQAPERKEEAAPMAGMGMAEEKPAALAAKAGALRKLPQKPIDEIAEETKGLSIKGLFEEEDSKEPLEISEMAQPEYDLELSELEKELKLLSGEDDTQTVAEEVETARNKCPTCGTRTEDIIFCPNCGSGFCNHCTPKAEVIGDKVRYICPECKKEANVRRQARAQPLR